MRIALVLLILALLGFGISKARAETEIVYDYEKGEYRTYDVQRSRDGRDVTVYDYREGRYRNFVIVTPPPQGQRDFVNEYNDGVERSRRRDRW